MYFMCSCRLLIVYISYVFSTYLSSKHSEPMRDLRSTYTCRGILYVLMIFIATNLHSYVTNNSLDTVAKDMEAV